MDVSRLRPVPWIALALAVPAATATTPHRESAFTEAERFAVVEYWSQPGRYSAQAVGEKKGEGPWQVRFTPEGSIWIRELYRLRSDGKVNPTKPPEALTEQQKVWDAWVAARAALDRWLAEQETAQRNALATGKPADKPSSTKPDEPGPAPDDLLAALPPPPAFYAPTVPYAHKVVFDDATIEYEDHVKVPDRYAYFRFQKGVRSEGTKGAGRDAGYVRGLFEKANVGEGEMRVFAAVSLLEGGFDAVNTYDTGYVSVGFIQFASLAEGAGSLGQVLLRMKAEFPDGFQSNFRRFGVDVTPEGLLAVCDPTIGVEFVGPDANQRIINDKRLIAVFQRAGQRCDEFNACQIEAAKALYYPAEDDLQVQVGDKLLACKVKDVFHSEAGMATLLDRKVNTGKLDPLGDYLYDLVSQTGITDLKEAAKYEWALTKAMAYRQNYLELSALSQPTRTDITLSRGNNPRDKRGGG